MWRCRGGSIGVKICYLSSDLAAPLSGSTGAAAPMRGLVRAFTALGHEVVVVAPGAGGERSDTELQAQFVPIAIPQIVAGMYAKGPPRLGAALGYLWNNVSVDQTLSGVLKTQRPDLVYERYAPFGLAGVLGARRGSVRHLLEVNALLAWDERRAREQPLHQAAQWIERAALDSASGIVTPTPELKDALISGGVAESKIRVAPNGVDADLFCPEGPVRAKRADGRFVLGFVGALRSGRGVDVLVTAFRRLASDPRYDLLVVGGGPEAKLVDGLARELPGRVMRVGPLPHREVVEYVRGMDIAIAPAPPVLRLRLSALALLEYMAAGRAIIAARVPPLADFVQEGVNGLLVPPGDADALAEAVRWLAQDGRLRRQLGGAAAAEARRAHLWTHRATQILEPAATNGASAA